MSRVEIHREVTHSHPNGWTLCFQWCTYAFDGDDPSEEGYRFMWRRPDGTLQAARGQARIPSVAYIFDLLSEAAREGWLHHVGAMNEPESAAPSA